jgi:rhodanese-related sulfurtransferase
VNLQIVALILVFLIASGCAVSPAATPSPAPTAEGSDQTMTIDQFAAALETPDAWTVVNVHIPYEGEVPNTDIQIAYNDVEALTAALPDRNAPIILYCRSGRMSEEASRALVTLGYTNVVDVPGGMNAWTDSGRDLLMSESGS